MSHLEINRGALQGVARDLHLEEKFFPQGNRPPDVSPRGGQAGSDLWVLGCEERVGTMEVGAIPARRCRRFRKNGRRPGGTCRRPMQEIMRAAEEMFCSSWILSKGLHPVATLLPPPPKLGAPRPSGVGRSLRRRCGGRAEGVRDRTDGAETSWRKCLKCAKLSFLPPGWRSPCRGSGPLGSAGSKAARL